MKIIAGTVQTTSSILFDNDDVKEKWNNGLADSFASYMDINKNKIDKFVSGVAIEDDRLIISWKDTSPIGKMDEVSEKATNHAEMMGIDYDDALEEIIDDSEINFYLDGNEIDYSTVGE